MISNNKIFTFWNYLPIEDDFDLEFIVSKWKNLGINVAMSFAYDYKNSNKDKMIELLDICERENIQLIINDTRTSYLELDSLSKEEFITNIHNAYQDFGKHKACYGFYIGDEPNFEHVDNFIFTAQKVLEIMHNLIPFGNLLPYWGDKKACLKAGHSEQFFYDLVNRILKETKLPIIGFDHYTQCYDSYMNQEKGIEFFLYDLRMYQKVCTENKTPFIVSLLALDHWHYRLPTADDIRWQISTSFAHGASGICWFYFHQKCLDTGFGNAPFIGNKFLETPIYKTIEIEQKRIIDNYFPLFNDLDFLKINYIDKKHHYKYKDENIVDFKQDRKLLTFISYFKDRRDNSIYMMITNGSQKYSNHYRYQINDKKEDFWLLPGAFILTKINS